jgi:transcription elongation factor Elf1
MSAKRLEELKIMQCPVCKNHDHVAMDLRSGSFTEDLVECKVCDTMWSVSHGVMAIIKDSMADSFLEALSASVEGDNFSFAAA